MHGVVGWLNEFGAIDCNLLLVTRGSDVGFFNLIAFLLVKRGFLG